MTQSPQEVFPRVVAGSNLLLQQNNCGKLFVYLASEDGISRVTKRIRLEI